MSNVQQVLTQAHLFATSSSSSSNPGGIAVIVVVIILTLAGMWKMYTKAGKHGWAVIIPIYNVWVQLQIIKRPWWWLILSLIPFVNIIIAVIMANDTAKAFGKGGGYTLLFIFLPFIGYPMVGFGDATYQPALLER